MLAYTRLLESNGYANSKSPRIGHTSSVKRFRRATVGSNRIFRNWFFLRAAPQLINQINQKKTHFRRIYPAWTERRMMFYWKLAIWPIYLTKSNSEKLELMKNHNFTNFGLVVSCGGVVDPWTRLELYLLNETRMKRLS